MSHIEIYLSKNIGKLYLKFQKTIPIVLIVIFLCVGSASAATITVDDSGGANYTSIQDAINNANSGDTIEVRSGTYYENVDVNKQLILSGMDTGGGKPVVDGNGVGSSITLNVNGIRLEGFQVMNSTTFAVSNSADEGGIKVVSTDNIIKNNIVTNNEWYGLYIIGSENSIEDNLINYNARCIKENGQSSSSGAGIINYGNNNEFIRNEISFNQFYGFKSFGSFNTLDHNVISNNNFVGLVVDGTYNLVEDNIVSSNNLHDAQPAIALSGEYNTLIRNIISDGNSKGIDISLGNNNIISYNKIINNSMGLYLSSSSNNTISYNEIELNNEFHGIRLVSGYIYPYNIPTEYNKIYNNYFNNSNNYGESMRVIGNQNYWNNTLTSETNIVGGPYVGGNFWGNPSGTGFSQTCTDTNNDGICDSSYTLDSLNIDYLPLAAPDTTPPTITGYGPTGNNIPVTPTITAMFNENMDQASVQTAFSTLPSTTGTFSWNGNNLTYTPTSNLNYSTTYSVNVGTGAMDLAGNHLASTYSWQFSTAAAPDTTPPTITGYGPTGNNIPVNPMITAMFNESMDQASVQTAFSTSPSTTGDFTWIGNIMTYTTTSNLSYSTTYSVNVGTGAMDLAGNHLASTYSWQFSTAAAPDTTPPTITGKTPTGSNVPVTPTITVNFNEGMNQASVQTAFSTSPATTGTFSWSSNTMTYTPTSNLGYSTTYSAIVGTGAMDLVGNHLASTYSWEFGTVVAPTPCGNTLTGQNMATNPTANVNVNFDYISACGDTTAIVQNSNQGTSLPSNYNHVIYYDIDTTAIYSSLITVKITYSVIPSNIDENSLKLFHYEGGNWVDVTTLLDTASKTLTGRVTSLSPFAVAGTPLGGQVSSGQGPVGGIIIPVNKPALLAPYIALASVGIFSITLIGIFLKHRKE